MPPGCRLGLEESFITRAVAPFPAWFVVAALLVRAQVSGVPSVLDGDTLKICAERILFSVLFSLWWPHVHEQALGAQTVPGALVLRCAQCIGPYQGNHFLLGRLSAQGLAIVGVIADEHGI